MPRRAHRRARARPRDAAACSRSCGRQCAPSSWARARSAPCASAKRAGSRTPCGRGPSSRRRRSTRRSCAASSARTASAGRRRHGGRASGARRRATTRSAQTSPPELVPLFERVKRAIKASPRMSPTEAFLHYAEETPDDVLAAMDDKTDALIRELEGQYREAPFAAPAALHARAAGRGAVLSLAQPRPCTPAGDGTIRDGWHRLVGPPLARAYGWTYWTWH